ncbi:glycosyltransferase family 8 protein [Clostridium sp. OS1-26]|uniref:glycosyltransferase family 8 protein n=1 Tax=Clostridium sp. OS1-26 TaxID=3070681 RepID=UPI0027DFF20B|nr:glycosyltransferase family 8 protein [Clostridium sp. OS1-26]WML36756.1 glycosyltransferase family 8 protein [Clostridium sp. OS1-26]
MSNIVPVILNCTNEYFPFTSVALYSLIQNSSNDYQYEITIMNTNISLEYQKKFLEFVKNRENVKINFFDVEDLIKGYKLPTRYFYTIETYFRFLVPDILKNHSKALYLDCDIVVNGDVSDLYNIDIENYYLAACKDADAIGGYESTLFLKNYIDNELKLKDPHDYFQAGVLLLNLDKIRKDFSTQSLLNAVSKKLYHYLDQDYLNIIFEDNVLFLNQKWNVLINWRVDEKNQRLNIIKKAPKELADEYFNARKNPCIIHYAGHHKPWNTKDCDYYEEFWKYAVDTPFYDIIKSIENKSNRKNIKNIIKRVVMTLLPYGSKRREIIKSIHYNLKYRGKYEKEN